MRHLPCNLSSALRKKLVLSWLIFATVTPMLRGQWNWEHYHSANSSLPDNTVYALAAAPAGAMWVGTDFGLCYVEGSSWSILQTANSGLPGNIIRSLCTAPDGALWVGTFSNGVARFDGTTWTTYNTANSGLADNYVRAIAFEPNGVMWLGTAGGLCRFDGSTWTTYDQTDTDLRSDNICALQIDRDGVLWIGTINGGLSRYQNGTITTFFTGNSPITDNTVLDIAVDDNNNKYLATPSGGLNVLTSAGTWFRYTTANTSIPTNSITGVAIRGTTAMLSTENAGLLEFGTAWTRWNTTNSPLPTNFLTRLAYATDGALWLGTPTHGIVVLRPSSANDPQPDAAPSATAKYLPSARALQLQLPQPATAALVTLQGQVLQQGRFEAGAQYWSVPALPTGMYLLQLAYSHCGCHRTYRFIVP